MTVLLAGGAGYIGTHTALALAETGYGTVIADNYSNSRESAVRRVELLAGKSIPAYAIDVRDTFGMAEIMRRHSVDCVVHLAGFKGVGESVQNPLAYYRNNLGTVISLLEAMKAAAVKCMIFSSSATVYGVNNPIPYREEMPRGVCASPYGLTKAVSEQIIEDTVRNDVSLSAVLLRYFNPIGAHESGMIGESPNGVPNNLMPYITQTAVGVRERLIVFGGDYPTPDGTCRRDYIHVADLAEGHVKAVEYALNHTGTDIFNLGTGEPYSVLELIHAFEQTNGVSVPYTVGARRGGDLSEFWTDPSKARRVLGWSSRRSLADMCRDAWKWQKNNPNGYI